MTSSLSEESKNSNNIKLIKEVFEDSEFDVINKKVKFINSAILNIGNSILDIAKYLSEIKNFIKNNKWVELTDSGIFYLSGRTCRDLASAYQSWLFESKIPDNILAELSARSLAKIGNLDSLKRKEIISRLLEGEIFTESDLTQFTSLKQKTNFDYNHQIKKAMDICHSLTDAQKLRNFQNIMIINIKQKEEIIMLKNRIKDFKEIEEIKN
tara:strand:- start:1 stop:633 length:633 start_codon:yes stop_codon:yes gene_type:complete